MNLIKDFNKEYTLTLLAMALAFIISNKGVAQVADMRFTRLTVEQGLSQSTVKCILKDSSGYMWFGTRDGLNRYDGYNFKVFKREAGNLNSLSSNFITDLLEDKEGNIWVGTINGFCRYDPEKESFKRYHISKRSYYIADIFQDSKGIIWVGTNGGLYEFNPSNEIFEGHFHDPKNPHSLVDSGINKIMEDQQGNLWIATPLALDRYNPVTKVFTHYRHDPQDNKSLGEGLIRSVFQDSKQRIWIASAHQGISLYNPKEDSFTRFRHDPDNPNSLAHDDIISFTEDKEGRLWIGTQNGGLSIFDYDRNLFKNYTMDINDPSSIGGISIHSLYTDDNGNIWIGSWAGGVSMWSRYNNKFTHYSRMLDINSTNIYTIRGDSKGKIWIGIEDGGLVRFNPQDNSFIKYKNENHQYFPTNVILSIIEYNKDTLALGYHMGAFAFFDKTRGTFTHYLPNPADSNSIFGNVKPSLLKDSQGDLWIGDWGGGLSYYNKKNNSFINYPHEENNPKALVNGIVYALFEDRQENFWLGTEGGLSLFNRKTKEFTNYQHNPQDKQSISHNTVYSIFEDSRGILWIGTAGGLNKFNRETKTFEVYMEKDGLPNEVINSIEEDGEGNLWLGTNKGLSRFNPTLSTFRNYDTKDGVQGNEFNRGASYKTPDGIMFFGGTMGFNIFHPDSIQNNPYIPPVLFTDLQVFNRSLQAGVKNSILPKTINYTDAITLDHKQSVITFRYAALNFTAPGKNQYASMLEGFDKEWIEVGNSRQATYTNLDPGTYTFRVIASNNDGIWNKKGTSLIVHILPPFWQSWWFKLGTAIMLMGMGFTLFRYRLHKIRRQNQKLMQLVNERTQELVAKQEEINAQNEELLGTNIELSQRQEEIAIQQSLLKKQNQDLYEARQMIEVQNQGLDQEVKERTKEIVEYNQQLEQFAFIAAHNLRAPVARIMGLGQLVKLPGVTLEEERLIAEKMTMTAEELDQVVKDINTILEIRKNNTLSISEVDLKQEIVLIKANLVNEINNTKAEIFEDYSGGSTLHTVKPYLDSILLNLLSNAIKYRNPEKRPQISIKTETVDEYLCLQLSDNGLGIDLDAHKKNLFTLYKRFHSHVEGKGMGLYLVKTQVEALGGRITVESIVNQGTTFNVYLKNNSPLMDL